jgi:hypothetical protein
MRVKGGLLYSYYLPHIMIFLIHEVRPTVDFHNNRNLGCLLQCTVPLDRKHVRRLTA